MVLVISIQEEDVSAAGMLGKRGPRSLAPVFGLDRRAIATHEKICLVGERREKFLADLERLGER